MAIQAGHSVAWHGTCDQTDPERQMDMPSGRFGAGGRLQGQLDKQRTTAPQQTLVLLLSPTSTDAGIRPLLFTREDVESEGGDEIRCAPDLLGLCMGTIKGNDGALIRHQLREMRRFASR